MVKKQKNNNLDFIISKLKKSIGEIKVIEHTEGIYFGGIYEINSDKNTLTVINENGLEIIKQAEKDNLSTEAIYTDSNCMDVIDLNAILKVK